VRRTVEWRERDVDESEGEKKITKRMRYVVKQKKKKNEEVKRN
jgi:hypothetical protein